MEKLIAEYLSNLELELLNQKRNPIEFSRNWAKKFPPDAGVYILLEGDEIRYVGETSSLQKRMCQLVAKRGHVIKWKIAKGNFREQIGILPRKLVPMEVISDINQLIVDKFQIVAIPVLFGRIELEENIIKKYKPIYNTIGNGGYL